MSGETGEGIALRRSVSKNGPLKLKKTREEGREEGGLQGRKNSYFVKQQFSGRRKGTEDGKPENTPERE